MCTQVRISAANVCPSYPSALSASAKVSSFKLQLYLNTAKIKKIPSQGTVHSTLLRVTLQSLLEQIVGEGGEKNLPLTGKEKILSEMNPLFMFHTQFLLWHSNTTTLRKFCNDKAFTNN